MKLEIKNKNQIDEAIADRICNLIQSKPNCVLGLATGSSPIGVYKLLASKNISFKDVTTFNLDEYYPIDINNKNSYHYFMNEHLFSKIDINKSNIHFPSLDNNYDQMIDKAGGIDFQILGIGSNGHIAFNEPGTEFNSLTHIVNLASSTIKDNSRFFNSIDEVPTKAITMGLASIMKAKEIVIIVTGSNKANALKELMSGNISKDFPASILNNHSNVTVYADKEAAKLC